MATANLTLDRGGRLVTLDELKLIPCPVAPTGSRWRPVAHHAVLEQALNALKDAGYEVESMKLSLSRSDARFWAAILLHSQICTGVSAAVLLASSLDQSIALRFGYGSHVYACQNGAWRAERTISRRHTTHAVDRYAEAISKAISDIAQFKEMEALRIGRMRDRVVSLDYGEATLLRLYQDEGILSPRTLPVALKELREPSFEEMQECMNVWRIYNAVTFALKSVSESNTQRFVRDTVRLGAILGE
jgi:hypothetical protein